jgi:hypothetical protein
MGVLEEPTASIVRVSIYQTAVRNVPEDNNFYKNSELMD